MVEKSQKLLTRYGCKGSYVRTVEKILHATVLRRYDHTGRELLRRVTKKAALLITLSIPIHLYRKTLLPPFYYLLTTTFLKASY